MENEHQTKKIEKAPSQLPELFLSFQEVSGNFTAVPPLKWSPYKTGKEKLEYQTRLPIEIQPFIREYFIKHSEEMNGLLITETTESYLSHLKQAWFDHMQANRAIDIFLAYEINNPLAEWSPIEWRTARRLLVASMTTDHKKAMYSGGVKKKLDFETKKLIARYGHTDSNFEIKLLTPSFITFYEQRDYDHKRYMLSIMEGKPDVLLKDDLLQRYHGGDDEILELRMSELSKVSDIETLRKEIDDLSEGFQQRSSVKQYLMMERADVRAFEQLLEFDNTTEYEYTYSLKGLPDLFLREEILRRLKKLGKLPVETSVFALDQSAFLEPIDVVISDFDRHFEMILKRYRQHFDTCGTACVMSILEKKGLSLDEETELRIWEAVGKPYNFPGGLSLVLQRAGYHTSILQDDPRLLREENPEFLNMNTELVEAAQQYVALHKSAVNSGASFEIMDWGYDRIRSEVMRGNVCLIYLYVDEIVSHVVLVHGFRNDRLLIMDPLGSIKTLTADQLNQKITTPMGKRAVIVKKLPDNFFDLIDTTISSAGY